MFLKLRAFAVPAVVLALIAGCGGGVNEKALNEAQEKITALEAKGVPPAELSMPKVFLHSARDNHERKNTPLAKKAYDSLKVNLAKAQAFYDNNVATLGPKIEASKSAANKAKEELSGFQVRKIDSTLAVMDSFKRIDRPMQANNIGDSLVKLLPSLKEDEQKAKKLKATIPGEWVFEDKLQSVEVSASVAAVTRKVFKFGRDGKVHLIESKKGQSNPVFKEDWLFESWGTYDFKGDTIMLQISRFASVRQMFERLHVAENKWVKEPAPTYDSVITDGSQDRSITYTDLKDDFKKR